MNPIEHLYITNLGISLPKDCLHTNTTVLLTPGRTVAEIELGHNIVAFPEGSYRVEGSNEYAHCVYHLTVKSKY